MKMKTQTKYAAVGAAIASIAMVVPIAGAQPQNTTSLRAAAERQVALGIQAAPKTPAATNARARSLPAEPNPFLGRVMDATKVDYYGWRKSIEARATAAMKAREAAQGNPRSKTAQPVLVDEAEPANLSGLNDVLASGELISGVATDANPRARLLGTLAPPRDVSTNFASFDEDNGSISLASDTGVASTFAAMQTSATIGDGPHGSSGSNSGDFDFYSIDLDAGQNITATTEVFDTFDSVLVVYDADGEIIASNDDAGAGVASKLTFTPTAAGAYYVMVTGFSGAALPEDPFESASGLGAGSEGQYELLISTAGPDIDVYAIDLRAGDVIGASITGAGNWLQVFDPDGRETIGSTQDFSALYPIASPLPGGGNAVLAYTVAQDGRHFISVRGSNEGDYDATVELYRSGLANAGPEAKQRILVDFDGARVQTSVFSGPGGRQITGLAGFLGGWGLGPDDEDALIEATMEVVWENLRRDLIRRGSNPDFIIRLADSRRVSRRNRFGSEQVSRVVVGGTIAEAGISTIGVASSIDPGNFGHEDDALVLLDELSAPIPSPLSLNTYLAASAPDKIKLIATGLGNIIAHEAGHYLGNYHTDSYNSTANIMDEGPNLPNTLGTGPDELLGTGDDVDVDFGVDEFTPYEAYTGQQDTLENTAFGLTGGGQ